MTQKQNIKICLIIALFFISLGGWLLHLRIHPPSVHQANYIPFFIGLANTLIIPWLFFFRSLIHWAYILNGMSVIIGTILMAHYSLGKLPADFGWERIVLHSTLANIAIVFGKFAAGKAIFDLDFTNLDKEQPSRFNFARYPNLGWWLIHLITMATVYAVGVKLL